VIDHVTSFGLVIRYYGEYINRQECGNTRSQHFHDPRGKIFTKTHYRSRVVRGNIRKKKEGECNKGAEKCKTKTQPQLVSKITRKCKYINIYHNSHIGSEACPASHVTSKCKGNGKGKGHPRTGHEGPNGEYRYSCIHL
jgi:hypothetical protein